MCNFVEDADAPRSIALVLHTRPGFTNLQPLQLRFLILSPLFLCFSCRHKSSSNLSALQYRTITALTAYPDTTAFTPALPRLPVPTMDHTFKAFLKSVQPLLTPEGARTWLIAGELAALCEVSMC